MRVALDVGEGVVLAVDRHPLAGPDAVVIQMMTRNTARGAGGQRDRPVAEGRGAGRRW